MPSEGAREWSGRAGERHTDLQTKILIWERPTELSSRHVETVCTGGCLEDGRPNRLYPVDLCYLERHKQYSLYDWIEVPIAKYSGGLQPISSEFPWVSSRPVFGRLTPAEAVPRPTVQHHLEPR
jgi:hypothetical protein